MNLDALLEPVSAATPEGDDCGYRPRFREMRSLCEYLAAQAESAELERSLRAEFSGESAESDKRFLQDEIKALGIRIDTQIAPLAAEVLGGSASSSAAARALRERGEELLAREGKDLAVVVRMALGETAARGAQGLADSLQLMESLLDRYGDQLHPQPDDGDASERSRMLQEVSGGPMFLAVLRDATVVASGAGRMIFRDAEVLEGLLPRDSSGAGVTNDAHLLAIVTAAVAAEQGLKPQQVSGEQQSAALEALLSHLMRAAQHLRSLARKLGVSTDDAKLLKLLERAHKRLDGLRAQLAPAAGGAAPLAAAASTGAGDAGSSGAVNMACGAMPVPCGPLRLATREDARKTILAVAEFLENSEPAHPSALFLHRAAKLLQARSFFDIVQDLLPGASVDEITRLTGVQPPSS